MTEEKQKETDLINQALIDANRYQALKRELHINQLGEVVHVFNYVFLDESGTYRTLDEVADGLIKITNDGN